MREILIAITFIAAAWAAVIFIGVAGDTRPAYEVRR